MSKITYGVGDVVSLYDSKRIGVILPGKKYLYLPTADERHEPMSIEQLPSENKLFPLSDQQINQLNHATKNIIIAVLLVLGLDASHIKIGITGLREK